MRAWWQLTGRLTGRGWRTRGRPRIHSDERRKRPRRRRRAPVSTRRSSYLPLTFFLSTFSCLLSFGSAH
jgi:hypothetical protein